jgi:hypothetical protein
MRFRRVRQSIQKRLAAEQCGEACLAFHCTRLDRRAASAAKEKCFQQHLRMLEYSFMPQLEGGIERLNLDKLF